MFLFRTLKKDLKPIDKDIGQAKWVDKDKVTELLKHKKDKEFFENIKNQILFI